MPEPDKTSEERPDNRSFYIVAIHDDTAYKEEYASESDFLSAFLELSAQSDVLQLFCFYGEPLQPTVKNTTTVQVEYGGNRATRATLTIDDEDDQADTGENVVPEVAAMATIEGNTTDGTV